MVEEEQFKDTALPAALCGKGYPFRVNANCVFQLKRKITMLLVFLVA